MLRRLRYALALLLAVPGGLGAQREAARAEPLEIHFLDVGQGDAALIRLGQGAVLVDASRGRDIVLWLEDLGVDSLLAVIASHNHADHIGGMPAVLSDFPVGQYLFNGRPPENQVAGEVEALLAERGIAAPGPPWETIRLGDARITVVPTPLRGREVSENNSSLGVLVERGAFKALLTGDSEVDELNGWIEAGVIPDVDLLKAAHHGARDGVTPGWLQATRPEVVVISVGRGNSYGHPHPWAMRYYQAGGRKVYRTDMDGGVVVTVDRRGRYTIATTGPRAP
jgi:beta-lactamase superfamily II metal-dependent hydrolase